MNYLNRIKKLEKISIQRDILKNLTDEELEKEIEALEKGIETYFSKQMNSSINITNEEIERELKILEN
jgi:hypothetical protein